MAPRNINYNNTCFYKICCKDINIKEIYIGQTTDFTRRKYSHGHACYNDKRPDYNMRVYKFIRDNGGWDNWDMILIENCKCENRLYARRKEREYIEQFDATLNKQIPTQTHKEYNKTKYDANPELMRERVREWAKLRRIRQRKAIKDANDILQNNELHKETMETIEAMEAKKNKLYELLISHIQDDDIINEILSLIENIELG